MNFSLARFGFQAIGLRELGEAFLRMGRRDPKTRRGKVLLCLRICVVFIISHPLVWCWGTRNQISVYISVSTDIQRFIWNEQTEEAGRQPLLQNPTSPKDSYPRSSHTCWTIHERFGGLHVEGARIGNQLVTNWYLNLEYNSLSYRNKINLL